MSVSVSMSASRGSLKSEEAVDWLNRRDLEGGWVKQLW